jgi:hypothetical protein
MPAKRTNRGSAIVSAVFTSVIAPTLVALLTTVIKGDNSAKAASVAARPNQSATVQRDATTTAAVTLLPPVAEHFGSSWTSGYTPSVQPLAWRPETQVESVRMVELTPLQKRMR